MQCPRYVSAVLCGRSERSPGMVWIDVPRRKELTCLSSQIALAVCSTVRTSRCPHVPLPAPPRCVRAAALTLLPVVRESWASCVSRTVLLPTCRRAARLLNAGVRGRLCPGSSASPARASLPRAVWGWTLREDGQSLS